MIWHWLLLLLRALARLFVPPPEWTTLRVDPNARCPACGHRKGKIKAGTVQRKEGDKTEVLVVQHICSVCDFKWSEAPVRSRWPR